MAVEWYGPQFVIKARQAAGKRVLAAAIWLTNQIKERISRSQPTTGTGIRKRGLNPSAPGEYPKKVTGHLRRNVRYEFNAEKVAARVGTNVIYGKWLETGTRYMAARPWLTRAIKENQAALGRIIAKGEMPSASTT